MPCNLCRGQAHPAQVFRVQLKIERGHTLIPFEVRHDDVRMPGHESPNLVRDLSELIGFRTQHSKTDRPGHRRAVQQTRYTHSRLRKLTRRDFGLQRRDDVIAPFNVLPDGNQLGKRRVRLLGVCRYEESGCTGTDVSGQAFNLRHVHQYRFEASDALIRGGNSAPLRSIDTDQNLGAIRTGKKLLLYLGCHTESTESQ